MSAQIIPFPTRNRKASSNTADPIGSFQFSFGAGRTFIVTIEDGGQSWWTDGCGGGRAFLIPSETRMDGIELVIGRYTSYGAAFHASDDRPDMEAEAQIAMASHVQRAAALPLLPDCIDVAHWSEVASW